MPSPEDPTIPPDELATPPEELDSRPEEVAAPPLEERDPLPEELNPLPEGLAAPLPEELDPLPEELAAPLPEVPAAPTPEVPAAPPRELAAPQKPAAQTVTGGFPAPGSRSKRPELLDPREPVYRECAGYRLRLEAADLARLRDLPGSKGKSDEELGEAFFDGQAARLAASVAGDVPTPAELRVVVDPFSRQAFVAVDNHIRGILSF